MSALCDLSAFNLRATIMSVTLTIVLCTGAFGNGALDVRGFETVVTGAGVVVVDGLTAGTLGAGVLGA